MRHVFLIIAFLVHASAGAQQGHIPPGLADKLVKGNTIGLNLRYSPWVSFSIAGLDFPFVQSEPLMYGNLIGVDILVFLDGERLKHHFRTSLSLPSYIHSDANVPSAFYIDHYNSIFSRQQQSYKLEFTLINRNFLSVYVGALSTMLYEKKILQFDTGRVDEKWFAGISIGPGLATELEVTNWLAIRAETDLSCFLPYTNLGGFKTGYENRKHFSSTYHSLVFIPGWELSGKITASDNLDFVAGFRSFSQMGFGNASPEFSIQKLITYVFDDLQDVYIGLRYSMPARWTRRKLTPSCPLSG